VSLILTSEGQWFDFTKPEAHSYKIEEIAHALSNVGRFTGHTRAFYSVAQHSVLVSYHVPPEMALTALLHDASEAYLGDVSTHLKALLPEYKKIEQATERAIAKTFGTDFPLPVVVKAADYRMFVTEVRDLMPNVSHPDWEGHTPFETRVVPHSPEFAKREFLFRYGQLTGGRD